MSNWNAEARRIAHKYAGGLVQYIGTSAYGIVVGYEEWLNYIVVERPSNTRDHMLACSPIYTFNKRKYKSPEEYSLLEPWNVNDTVFKSTKESMVKHDTAIQDKLMMLEQTNNRKAAILAYKEFDSVMDKAEGRIMPQQYKEYIRRANFCLFLCAKRYSDMVRCIE